MIEKIEKEQKEAALTIRKESSSGGFGIFDKIYKFMGHNRESK